jgi:hypothetical protein
VAGSFMARLYQDLVFGNAKFSLALASDGVHLINQ